METLQHAEPFLGQELHRRLESDDVYDILHEPVFEAVNIGFLVLSTILVLTLGSLAAGAGIGGGGLFIPIYAFVLGVGAKAAVPLSKATILGAAIGNFLVIGFERHPKADRPIIDYEMSTYMQSGELLGVIFGVLLNFILPEIVLIIFLAALLTYNAVRTLRKGKLKYSGETMAARIKNDGATFKDLRAEGASAAELKEAGAKALDLLRIGFVVDELKAAKFIQPDIDAALRLANQEGEVEAKEEVELTTGVAKHDVALGVDAAESPQEGSSNPKGTNNGASLEAILRADAVQFPRWAWATIVGMACYTVLYAILRKEVFSPCEPGVYWTWYFTPVLVLGGIMVGLGVFLKQKHLLRIAAGFEYLPTDVQWTNAAVVRMPGQALLAGVVAGLLGIGGGMILGPMFIELGLEPKSASSSCAFMILWTATSGVIQYFVAGKVGWQFLVYFLSIGFISGQLGQRGVGAVLKKTGRPSIVVLLLGSIIAVACLAMTGTGIFKIAKAVEDGEALFQFSTRDFKCDN